MDNRKLKKGTFGKISKAGFRNRFIQFPQIATIIVFAFVFIIFSAISPRVFLSFNNLNNILEQTAGISIAAFGMTAVLLVGGIDLSVGGVMAVVGIVSAKMLEAGYPIILAVAAALGIAIAIGLLNGLIVITWKVQPFLVTLATMSIARGLALIIGGGMTYYLASKTFLKIFGTGTVFGIKSMIFWTIGSMVILYIIITKTPFGRRMQAIGGNEEAAITSGVNVKRIKIVVYIICSVMAALSGLIITTRLGSALPNMAQGSELDAIAASVLGGTGFAGEGGNPIGTLLGSLVIGTVVNGLSILGVSSYIQMVVKGAIILFTIIGSVILIKGRD